MTGRLWFACLSLGLGGADRAAMGWINALADAGVRIAVLVCHPGGIFERMLRPSVRVIDARGLTTAWLACHLEPEDAFVCDIAEPLIPLLPRARPLVRHMSCVLHSLGTWSRRFLTPDLLPLWDRVVVIAEHEVSEAIAAGVPSQCVVCVRNRFDAAEFAALSQAAARVALGLPARGFIVGYAGRACWGKRVVTLVAAVEILRRLGLDAHLALAGLVDERQAPEFVRYWSDCRDSMRTLARNLGIADRVHELPPTADMRPFYSACDATLLLSFAEGSPCMVWESLAAGVPVVSTHVGDVRNVATPETGSFVLPDLGDLATVAAGALNSIATRAPAIRERCRQAAVRRVRDLADVDRWQREDLPRMIEALTGGT